MPSPIITHKTSSSIDKTPKIVSSPKINHKTGCSIENTFKLDCSTRISLKKVSSVIFTFENEFSHKMLYKMCCSVFSRHFWVKKRVSGSKHVHNGSEQSGDVPRVFVKCVGVGVGVGRVKPRLKRGWRSLFFLLISIL